MSFGSVVRLVLPFYVLADYISGYRRAKRTVQNDPLMRPGSVLRWGAMFMVVFMPFSAFVAWYEELNAHTSFAQFCGIMVGITMNLLFFYSSCVTLMTMKSTRLKEASP
jgi:polyferredoxin